MTKTWTEELLGTAKPIIAMCHLNPRQATRKMIRNAEWKVWLNGRVRISLPCKKAAWMPSCF